MGVVHCKPLGYAYHKNSTTLVMALARLINNPIFFLQMKDKQIFFRFLKENNAYMAWLRNFKRVSHALKQDEKKRLSLLFRDDSSIRQVVCHSFSWFASQEGY